MPPKTLTSWPNFLSQYRLWPLSMSVSKFQTLRNTGGPCHSSCLCRSHQDRHFPPLSFFCGAGVPKLTMLGSRQGGQHWPLYCIGPLVPLPRPIALSCPKSTALTCLLQNVDSRCECTFLTKRSRVVLSALLLFSASPQMLWEACTDTLAAQCAPSCKLRPGLAGPSCLGWTNTGLNCTVTLSGGE